MNRLDSQFARTITSFGEVISTPFQDIANYFNRGDADNQPVALSSPLTQFKRSVKSVQNVFVQYHKQTANYIRYQSRKIEIGTKNLVERVLSPIPFKTGAALRTFLAQNIGLITYFVSYIALQILHALPYLIFTATALGLSYLYSVGPMAFFSFFGGASFLILLFFTYRLDFGMTQMTALASKKGDLAIEEMTKRADVVIQQAQEKSDAIYKQIENAGIEFKEVSEKTQEAVKSFETTLKNYQDPKEVGNILATVIQEKIEASLSSAKTQVVQTPIRVAKYVVGNPKIWSPIIATAATLIMYKYASGDFSPF